MNPIDKWTPEELSWKTDMVLECKETFGALAARQLSERLGFPTPPTEISEKTEGEKVADAIKIADLAIKLRLAELDLSKETRDLTQAYRDFHRMSGLEKIETGSPEYAEMLDATAGEYDAKMKARGRVHSARRKMRAAIDRHLKGGAA